MPDAHDSPIYVAAQNGHLETVICLVEAGVYKDQASLYLHYDVAVECNLTSLFERLNLCLHLGLRILDTSCIPVLHTPLVAAVRKKQNSFVICMFSG